VPRVSSKRQITLPIDQCRALDIEPGDVVETFVYKDQITIVKKERGSAFGRLRHLRGADVSDEQSREDAIKRRR
jgi:bifunctional DNA-binding transcriptional regulator/antitoxin component of YhaV-PrlF toxin-antitoxin module